MKKTLKYLEYEYSNGGKISVWRRTNKETEEEDELVLAWTSKGDLKVYVGPVGGPYGEVPPHYKL